MLTFIFRQAEDDSVDSEYALLKNGKDTGINIQDARSYAGVFVVSRFRRNCMELFGETKSLTAAKKLALKAARS